MSMSMNLNCSQSTTTMWAVSNERQDCGQHGGVERSYSRGSAIGADFYFFIIPIITPVAAIVISIISTAMDSIISHRF